MIRSMTGYGKGEMQVGERSFAVEIRAVNNKFCEFHIRMPRIFNPLEDRLRKLLAAQIFRGRIDVSVNFRTNSTQDAKIVYNEALAENYHTVLTAISRKFNLRGHDGDILGLVSRFPDVVEIDRDLGDTALDSLWSDISSATEDAISRFLTMRETEGAVLAANIREKGLNIEKLLAIIEKKAPDVTENYRKKLQKRMEDALAGVVVDEQRFLNEVAHFADKSAIDEEITRLKSHLAQLPQILDEGGAVGRKLDFLAQELAREANTIGSKANFADITKVVIDLKGEIEKIREQVQNIE
ncbi:MAG: YicC family protein [Defluviitaleaceae bacterium]|nr:YicC family protein [Defluviitaleaceae bacterium]